MNLIFKNMNFFWWCVKPLFFWVVSRSTQEDVKSYLDLDPNKPTLYILPKRSFFDLLVLYYHCRKNKLPLPTKSPHRLAKGGEGGFLYLSKPGLLQTRSSQDALRPLVRICKRVDDSPQLDVQLVPVSIFWGKNPGKENLSLLKLIFNDDESAGALHKLLIVMVQGRNNIFHAGKAFSVREQLHEKMPIDQTAKKLRRVLKVHFRRQRNSIVGHRLYIREQVIRQVLAAPSVQKAIEHHVGQKKGSQRRSENLARKYAKEIASDQRFGVIRLLEILLGWLWNKLFKGIDVQGIEKIREYSDQDYEIVYVPNHRSHMDYLLLGYFLYWAGLPAPHTAAGVNLNFWPVGPLLRRGGAFFIKRRFSGNRLYAAVFSEYLHYLLSSGYHVAFFPEGGRSRTGRLLPAKSGMISMVLESAYLKPGAKPVVLVPIYVGYDRVVEVRSYLKELSGAGKRKESFGQFLKTGNIFKTNWGKAYISVGDPIDTKEPSFDKSLDLPDQIHALAKDYAVEIGVRINQVAVIAPTALVSLALLATSHRALPAEELEDWLLLLLDLSKHMKGFEGLKIPESDPKKMIAETEDLKAIRRFQHPGGDVFYLTETDAVYQSYYKNNILHIYALPSLIACFFVHSNLLSKKELVLGCLEIYPFLQNELFLPWPPQDVEGMISQILATMADMGLLQDNQEDMARPDLGSLHYSKMTYLARIIGLVIERYAIVAALLAKHLKRGRVNRADFELQCQKMAQRLAILSGVTHPEAQDKSIFSNHILLLKKMGFVSDEEQGEWLMVDQKVEDLFTRTKILLSPDTRHSIERLALVGES